MDPFEPRPRSPISQYRDPRDLLRGLGQRVSSAPLRGPAGQLYSALSGRGISVGDETGSISVGPDGSLGIDKGNWRASVGFGRDPSFQVGFNLGGRDPGARGRLAGLVEEPTQEVDRPQPTPEEFLDAQISALRERVKDPYWYRP